MIEIGSVVADTYTIEGELGRGGMGTVFLASHSRLPGKRVALKDLEKPSAWGKLARAGHRVVEFKDAATNRYIGVTVDGERVGGVPEAP